MKHDTTPLLSAVPGTARTLDSFRFGPADAEKRVYIQGALHADELPGMLVAWTLKQRLNAFDEAGLLRAEVIVVPVANPIGLDQQLMDVPLGRYDFESLANFNRHFADVSDAIAEGLEPLLSDDAAHNQRVIRERFYSALGAITPANAYEHQHLVLQQLACRADYVLDLHCDFEAVPHLYTTPNAWPTFEPLARYIGSMAQPLAADSGGQSFDECFTLVWEQLRTRFGDRYPIPYGTASVTVELRGQGDVDYTLAEQDSDAILNWMRHHALIDEPAPALPDLLFPATELSAMEFLKAPAGGLLVFHVAPGTEVHKGQRIADIIDPISDEVHPVTATQAGMLYARNQRHMATRGMIVADIAGFDAKRSGYLLAP
ncbi:succinylglutamate desuccinylase/aspartoacylase family protein [Phytohalomonas tamaricis]|uniref:succinylglutamate desuccinylase/aspartoacylase family protein n=1 Tax=Phytohalomonas tamaricis TaxID=2081032 RepID=UPI000D0B13E3|nr:succinylglutamate desuccinylase/aspartoacylase family protein [Phytohalomonas tamaricis]